MNLAETYPCPICKGASPIYGAVDFHKSCLEAQGRALNPSGLIVHYRHCGECGFVFCDTFKAWTPDEFKACIYNQDYAIVDPDFSETRPTNNATVIDALFTASKDTLSILDYGGGNGLFAELLRAKGYQAQTYDPFSEHRQKPLEKADLITAFEVIEHSNTPHETIEEMASLIKPEGIILFSTLLQPADFSDYGLKWWYVAPRNGHVSIFSETSLKRLLNSHGLQYKSVTEDVHIAYR